MNFFRSGFVQDESGAFKIAAEIRHRHGRNGDDFRIADAQRGNLREMS
jgi:hypothetical protein